MATTDPKPVEINLSADTSLAQRQIRVLRSDLEIAAAALGRAERLLHSIEINVRVEQVQA